MVVERFGDTYETYSDLQDESVALADLQLMCLFYLVLSLGRRGRGGGADSNAMLYCLDSNAICTCLLLKFVSLILVSGSKKP